MNGTEDSRVDSQRSGVDEVDQIKIDTWYQLINLLMQYRDLALLPEYGERSGLFSSHNQARERKLKTIRNLEHKLFSLWERELGSNWQVHFYPD